jgi:hypothetical protein
MQAQRGGGGSMFIGVNGACIVSIWVGGQETGSELQGNIRIVGAYLGRGGGAKICADLTTCPFSDS